MKALVKTEKGIGFLEIRDVPKPEIGNDEVLIRVRACGICGSDIHVRHDSFPYWPPVILGHEFTGEIVEIGREVKLLKEGDRVVAEPHTQACGHCYLCRTGNIQICNMKRSPGWGIDGGMAEYVKMPEKLLHKIPDNMPFDLAAVVEPVANTVHDITERARVEPGDFVAILGPGPIGLLAGMTARAAGAYHVAIIGAPADEAVRLKKARELGFDTVINLAEENPIDKINELTGGIGADLVIECSGSPKAIASTVDMVRKKGRICAIGLPGNTPVEFPWNKAQFKVCDIIFNLSTSYTSWDRSINLVSTGQIPAGEVISHREPLDNWEEVFDAIEAQQALKGILLP